MLSAVRSPVHACSPSLPANYADVQLEHRALQLHVSGAPSEEIDIDLADFTHTHKADCIKSTIKGWESNTVPSKKKHKPMSEEMDTNTTSKHKNSDVIVKNSQMSR